MFAIYFLIVLSTLNKIKKYIETTNRNESDEDDLFFFGEKLGDGSEEHHFSLGMTCMAMLKGALKTENLFHIDATYKIIKYSYPLIIIGVSDAVHKFFPIAMMLSSHETIVDYTHFFESLNELIKERLDFEFRPKFIMSDAASAIAVPINTIYPDCQRYMCYFHVVFNVHFLPFCRFTYFILLFHLFIIL
jgi:hypothetical protein